MRNLFLAAVALGAVAFVGIAPSPGWARDYPFCIKGDFYDSPIGDCGFDTYQQCMATASGRLAYCDANPYYAYPTRPDFARPRKHHGNR